MRRKARARTKIGGGAKRKAPSSQGARYIEELGRAQNEAVKRASDTGRGRTVRAQQTRGAGGGGNVGHWAGRYVARHRRPSRAAGRKQGP